MLSVVSGGLGTPLVGSRVGSGIPVAVAVAVAVEVSVAVSEGVTVGGSVGTGVGVAGRGGVGGMEVGTGRVGIKVGSGMEGENVNPAIAMTVKHSRVTSAARIPNCGQVRPRKVFFCLSGDGCIHEPFTGRVKHKKRCWNWYYRLLAVY